MTDTTEYGAMNISDITSVQSADSKTVLVGVHIALQPGAVAKKVGKESRTKTLYADTRKNNDYLG